MKKITIVGAIIAVGLVCTLAFNIINSEGKDSSEVDNATEANN